MQTHGSLANWHPHRHLLVTDGGCRRDGTFVPLPRHDVTTLTEAEHRALTVRLARYCARHPVGLGRLAYRSDTGAVT